LENQTFGQNKLLSKGIFIKMFLQVRVVTYAHTLSFTRSKNI